MSLQIEVTPQAVAKLAELGTDKKADYVRVSAQQACGCGRIGYRMAWEEHVSADDEQFQAAGVTLVVDANSRPYIDGGVLDYQVDSMQEGFVLTNPHAQNGCSCGSH
ncbi:HesB/IscA family protein [Sulfobacillus thermosulfidooxidans]|uniref:HesB/IscA family protein n=1 Tax=Sulfobacillus thermosulfidooxidans TaxID=28034 RepID=UPI0006B56B89|nr:iron-sulfur cluster assembly accessory protein [Sulfobacillus thermosulfidooxidans]